MRTNITTQSDWIEDGEEYALVGLQIKAGDEVRSGKSSSEYSVLIDTSFAIPTHWKQWLGSMRVEEIERCNLFLLAKAAANAVNILNEEDKTLRDRVYRFYVGLMLSSRAVPAHRPVMLCGSRRGEEIGVRQVSDLPAVVLDIVHRYPSLTGEQLRSAATLAKMLEDLHASMPRGHWRLFRTLALYIEARTTSDLMERIHLFCRCIDGLILPQIGRTAQQFKSRTELFIGPRHHELMGALYDIRSAAEHLNENRYLADFDRAIRLDLAKKDAIVEWIVRSAIAKILRDSNLWLHFANATALAAFWALPAGDQRRMWGHPMNPLDPIADFDEAFVSDGELGK